MLPELNRIYQGDTLTTLKTWPDAFVHCVVTSPPYWGLRDYGVKGQLGLEATPEEYVERMVAVFREVRRVLRDDGTLWLNIGDSYAAGKMGRSDAMRRNGHGKFTEGEMRQRQQCGSVSQRKPPAGIKPKDLVGIPWLLAFALRKDGWYLRQDIIWSKPNPMPESVRDRCTKAHEYIFMFSKSAKYFYDQDAIKEPGTLMNMKTPDGWNTSAGDGGHGSFVKDGREKGHKDWKPSKQRGHGRKHNGFNDRWDQMEREEQCSTMVNKRSVWTISPQPFPESHFATFPEDLVSPCILAGSPDHGTVLDPFMGAGTTGLVSARLSRNFLGVELNPEYIKMAEKRIAPELAQGKLL